MATRKNSFTTIRTEGALLPPDLLQRISEGATLDGLTPQSYHRPGEKLNEVINRSWNVLQGAWASFRAAQQTLPHTDLGTSITRERWLLPLFRELDYGRLQTAAAVEIDGRTYPVSHGWEHVPIHLVSYRLELDRRTPGAAGAASASPHSLVQVLLNRSEANLWGFLSNGYRLRILRDNASLTRQAFVEFDLEAMMDGEVYSDFVLLWLLCHQSRVEGERPADCWLEKWMKVAEDQGTRALDQLRDGVQSAIEALGLGFLEHPANAPLRDKLTGGALTDQDYYRQLLRLVYRLLFLFVAEDRDLLLSPAAAPTARERYVSYYSTQRLRRMAESFKGTRHADLFESLRLVMRLLSGETSPHPKSFSQGEKDFLRRGSKDAEVYENIASQAMIQMSRELRQVQTSAEEIMWEALRNRRLNNLKFRRQHPIAETQYVTDFMCYEARLVVEIDGDVHNQQQVADAKRQADIEALGYRVMRFTNDMVFNDLQWVLASIAHASQPPSTLGRGAGGEGLALVPLGSFLFSDAAAPDVIDCQLANPHLLDAIRALSLTYDTRTQGFRTVDYKNLGSDELGGIFESLLELHPHINVPARRFTLETAAGNERKTTVSYYTPESLVHALLDSALNPVLHEATRQGEAAILALKVCDPACGSGHFLIAAANRIAKALAFVRTGEEEPPPVAVQEAKRDVISHCIYGVDINPMAVELCKVNLWMEALEPGKPLNFLDHRIQVGNSLLGTTPKLMAGGIPDDAFNPIEGDDSKYAASMKKLNRDERKARATGQRSIFELVEPPADYGYLTSAMHALDDTPDDTLDEVRHKEARYAALANDPEYVKARLLADAWCAAFVWEKNPPLPLGEGNDAQRRGVRALAMPLTDLLYRRMEDNPLAESLQPARAYVVELAQRYQFFHWHVAFPDVFSVSESLPLHLGEGDLEGGGITGWDGGFDCVLGNPPWERIKIQEKEWFAQRAPEIATAPNAAARRKAIAELEQRDPYLLEAFAADKRKAEGESHFVRVSERYPLCGRGDVNTYTIFAETSRHVINGAGRVGMIVPSGIATDDTTKFFFQDLMQSRSLASLYDFENREGLFAAVDSRMKFCLLTMSGGAVALQQAQFVFFALNVGDLADADKRFTLSADDIAMLNPNTGTIATFRSVRDAEITKAIYRRVPVLIRESPPRHLGEGDLGGEGLNAWGISFLRMFDMSNDSGLFRTRAELEAAGYTLQGNRFIAPTSAEPGSSFPPLPLGEGNDAQHRGVRAFLPLYEAKMMHQFTHRWATYANRLGEAPLGYWTLQPEGADADAEKLATRDLSPDELRDPSALVMPRYWVDEREVTARIENTQWLLGFRDITNTTNEHTAIFGLLPRVAVGHVMPLVFSELFSETPIASGCFASNINTFIFDYNTRQKLGGTHLTYGYFKQLPVIPPHTYTPALLDFIVPRVLELTYTAWDLQPFAQDVGYDGAPFIWDEERRFLMRCELDALYFHLYAISRPDADYIMDTFPIVKRKDEAAYSTYRTKDTILSMYDQMAALPTMPVPAPKSSPLPLGEGNDAQRRGVRATYAVPDVSHWQTWLNPPPAHPSVAHPPQP